MTDQQQLRLWLERIGHIVVDETSTSFSVNTDGGTIVFQFDDLGDLIDVKVEE